MTDMDYIPPSFDYYLEHHGVKGMKWGVRRSQSQLQAARLKSTTRREKLSTKQKITGEKRRVAEDRQMQSLAKTVSKNKRKNRKHLARDLEVANKAIAKDEKLLKKLRQTDKKINRLDKKIVKAGEREVKRILKAEAREVKMSDIRKQNETNTKKKKKAG